jgi:hypothetical protein
MDLLLVADQRMNVNAKKDMNLTKTTWVMRSVCPFLVPKVKDMIFVGKDVYVLENLNMCLYLVAVCQDVKADLLVIVKAAVYARTRRRN